jgi:uncharacterized lipoprotein
MMRILGLLGAVLAIGALAGCSSPQTTTQDVERWQRAEGDNNDTGEER